MTFYKLLLMPVALILFSHNVHSSTCPGDTLTSQAEVDAYVLAHFPCDTILGSLAIEFSADITDLSGLTSVQVITESFRIRNNSALTTIPDFNLLEYVGGSFDIQLNASLTTINGFPIITYLGAFEFLLNESVVTFPGFPSLLEVEDYFRFNLNEDLLSIGPINQLNRVGGEFVIANNESLLQLDGPTTLQSIGSRILVQNNNDLMTISGFEGLQVIEEFGIWIFGNANLTSITGFDVLTDIGDLGVGTFRISDHSSLTTVNAFNELTALNGLSIADNPLLQTMSAFAKVERNIGNLFIFNNGLTALNGFLELSQVDGDFIISNHISLTEINGFRILQTISGNFDLSSNLVLNDCCGLFPLLSAGQITGSTTIAMNSFGCNSRIEILNSCPAMLSDCTPNCRDINAGINPSGDIQIMLADLLANPFPCATGVTVTIQNEYGGDVQQSQLISAADTVVLDGCNYLRSQLKVRIETDQGACWSIVTVKDIGPPIVNGRFFELYCNEEAPAPSLAAIDVCDGIQSATYVADWVEADFDCESDTAKVIYREYEAFDKEGNRGFGYDTIIVYKLPQIVNIDLSANFRNIGCVEKDTMYCGINEFTDPVTGQTPVGPYLLVVEDPANPADDVDGDGVNCDTIYFCAFDQNKLIDLTGDFEKCGISVHKDFKQFGGPCEKVYKGVIELKQTCYGTPNILDCFVPGNHQNIEQIAPGYYKCEFWITDIDTVPPAMDVKVFGEYDCVVANIESTDLSGFFDAFDQIFVPLVPTSNTECAAHTYLPPVCVYDDWSGIKQVKAIVEGGSTYILEKEEDPCLLVVGEDVVFSLDELLILFGDELDTLDEFTQMFVDTGYCYRSHEIVKLPANKETVRVFYEVYDSCHLIGYDTVAIKIKDATKPVPVAEKGVTVNVSNKKVWVPAETFDEGSHDNCGVHMILARRTDWAESCVDLCYNAIDGEDCDHGDTEAAYDWIWTDQHDTLWCLTLEDDKHCDEVEAHYSNYLDWLCEDENPCGPLLYNSWQYDLIKYATLECKGYDYLDDESFHQLFKRALGEPKIGTKYKITNQVILDTLKAIGETEGIEFLDDNVIEITEEFELGFVDKFKCQDIDPLCISSNLTESEFFGEEIFIELFGCFLDSLLFPGSNVFLPGIFSEPTQDKIYDKWKDIGGGWSDAVPFDCEDICEPVTVEILVMDYWCNYAKAWSTVWPEDKVEPKVVKEVAGGAINCASFRESNRHFSDEYPHVSLQYIAELAQAGDEEANAYLDGVFGTYCPVWVDEHGNYVDENWDRVTEEDCLIEYTDLECDYNTDTELEVWENPHTGEKIWKEVEVIIPEFDEVTKYFQKGLVAVNCDVKVDVATWLDQDHCGEGYLYRKFKIYNGCSYGDTEHGPDTIYRYQSIWIGNDCELEKYHFDVPEDVFVESCELEYDDAGNVDFDAMGLGEQVGHAKYIFDDDCRLVGIAKHDEVFKVVGGDEGCYKILRKWIFIDWCQYGQPDTEFDWYTDPAYTQDTITCVQKIIIVDTTAPVCDIIGEEELGAQSHECIVNYPFTVEASDSTCPLIGEFTYLLKKIEKDDIIDVASGSGTIGQEEVIEELGEGEYVLKVITKDKCNNEGICEKEFEIINAKQPTPICLSSLTVELTPMDLDSNGTIDTAMATIWADEFDISSTAPCGQSDNSLDFRIEFLDGIDDDTLNTSSNDPNLDDDELMLGCEHVGVQLVRLWVIAQTGAANFCDVLLEVQNNMGGCPEDGSGSVEIDPSITESIQTNVINTDGFALYQNNPNPFSELTNISFKLPEAAEAIITVYDVTGKVLKVIEGDYAKGLNAIQIRKDDINCHNTGVMYYQLDTDHYTATKKMILVE